MQLPTIQRSITFLEGALHGAGRTSPSIIPTLQDKFLDFRQAYEPDGLAVSDFDSHGATRRTLRGFLQSVYDLVAVVRDSMVPAPDHP